MNDLFLGKKNARYVNYEKLTKLVEKQSRRSIMDTKRKQQTEVKAMTKKLRENLDSNTSRIRRAIEQMRRRKSINFEIKHFCYFNFLIRQS